MYYVGQRINLDTFIYEHWCANSVLVILSSKYCCCSQDTNHFANVLFFQWKLDSLLALVTPFRAKKIQQKVKYSQVTQLKRKHVVAQVQKIFTAFKEGLLPQALKCLGGLIYLVVAFNLQASTQESLFLLATDNYPQVNSSSAASGSLLHTV